GIAGSRLAHEARGRRIFGTARHVRRRRAAGQKRQTRDSSNQASGYLPVFNPHSIRRVQTVGDDSKEAGLRTKFSIRLLGYGAAQKSRGRLVLELVKDLPQNYPVSRANKLKPAGQSGQPHKADPSSPPLPRASAQLVKLG